MADLKEDKIDFSKLEKELSSAVEADASYWRENDAKIRAMEQRVETYDQFRDMVAAAHIKPLDKKDKIGKGRRNQPWNPFSSTNSTSSPTMSAQERSAGKKSADTKVNIPKNGHEFTKEWQNRKRSLGSCYTYVTDLGGDTLARIFRSEISFGLLGEIITVLNNGAKEEHCGKVADILMCLARAGRFNLSLDFLSKAEKQVLCDLVEKLERWSQDVNRREQDGGNKDEEKGEEVKGDDSGRERLEGDGKEETKQEEVIRGNAGDNCSKLSVSEEDIGKLKEIYKLVDK